MFASNASTATPQPALFTVRNFLPRSRRVVQRGIYQCYLIFGVPCDGATVASKVHRAV